MNTQARILVVDDEEVVRRSFERILSGPACSVRSVSTGSEVSQAMDEETFDVVLLDLRMPGMDGMTVLDEIKRHWPHSEVVIVTGYPTLETARQALQRGAYDYLAKPVDPEQVIRVARGAWLHKQWALRPEGNRFPAQSGNDAAYEPIL
jgi:DNA-binding NtrC family response regulator